MLELAWVGSLPFSLTPAPLPLGEEFESPFFLEGEGLGMRVKRWLRLGPEDYWYENASE
jgi:hypothetical protein